ncbi:hypothetical protein EV138_0313 [Kribbella voronezhensis]|uniref:Uncharacterized protein n=1 Tax=Kribbella voronezhensis TaxID=2512212 RepID=A0A4R7T6T5_9ACTN|nr:hypothetical protein EV138_0313 [Kribbella voronezhensis]
MLTGSGLTPTAEFAISTILQTSVLRMLWPVCVRWVSSLGTLWA